VTATLSAWGDTGPWCDRRGFDSLVQSASGIAVQCTPPDAETPGALPAQALDHGTGHLIAAAVLRGLAHRTQIGRPLHSRFALARTAAWLQQAAGRETDNMRRFLDQHQHQHERLDPADYMVTLGDVTLVSPPGELDGSPLRWTRPPEPIGSSPPSWW
jgi:crotonobetainyl-CoA:carnitine CoA-transferase CaiB-like acyl-CoA transferase